VADNPHLNSADVREVLDDVTGMASKGKWNVRQWTRKVKEQLEKFEVDEE
jgi:hypothetical protein